MEKGEETNSFFLKGDESMAAPLAAVAGKIAQRIMADLLTDPEKAIKGITLSVLLPVFLIVVIFALPVLLIVSIPTLLVDGASMSPADQAKRLATIAIYSSAPETINQENLRWIDEQKKVYASYDDIVVQVGTGFTWQQLMAVDAVRLNQDFNKVNNKGVISLAEKFLSRNVHSETFQVQEPNIYSDAEGNHTGSGTVTVTKRRAVIEISMKSYNAVLNELGFTSSDIDITNNIYSTIMTSQAIDSNGGSILVSNNVLNWRSQIEAAATKYNVDSALIAAIIQTESGGNPRAMSPVGAIGLMQLMPGTAHDLGVNPYDPSGNIDGGAHYVATLLSTFSLQDAAAAYNAGPRNVLNGHWVLFPETVNYVARVQQLYQLYKPIFARN